MKIDTTFVRIGSINGQKQNHGRCKKAPCIRGIWALPKIYGHDVYYLSAHRIPEHIKVEGNMCKFVKQNKLRREFKLNATDSIWHHMNDFLIWEECSVREYFKKLILSINKCKPYYIDGEYIEVFIKM